MRLSASEVESAVLSEMRLFLKTPQILIRELVHKNDDVATQQYLAETGKQQAEILKPSDIQNMVQRVEIGKQTLTITCSESELRNWLLNENNTAEETFSRAITRYVNAQNRCYYLRVTTALPCRVR